MLLPVLSPRAREQIGVARAFRPTAGLSGWPSPRGDLCRALVIAAPAVYVMHRWPAGRIDWPTRQTDDQTVGQQKGAAAKVVGPTRTAPSRRTERPDGSQEWPSALLMPLLNLEQPRRSVGPRAESDQR